MPPSALASSSRASLTCLSLSPPLAQPYSSLRQFLRNSSWNSRCPQSSDTAPLSEEIPRCLCSTVVKKNGPVIQRKDGCKVNKDELTAQSKLNDYYYFIILVNLNDYVKSTMRHHHDMLACNPVQMKIDACFNQILTPRLLS